ncbi:MAG: 4-hydroxy-tetrahydrodipicolinate synthase, partial [Planctomycetia bacterium]
CLAPCGTTGESPTLDHEEHRRVIQRVVKRAAGKLRVMVGTGSNSTSEAAELTKFAGDVGADGALMVAPYYNKPMQEGYRRHFEAVADRSPIPIVLYNIPGRTGSNMLPETVCEIGRHPRVVAIKEASGLMDQASYILGGSDLTVLSGDDSLTLPMMSMGGGGIVSVVGNIVPKDLTALVDAFVRGDIETARRMHFKLYALCKDMLTLATNPIPVKAAMKLLGRGTGVLRLPMTPLEAAGEAKLRNSLVEYGLL